MKPNSKPRGQSPAEVPAPRGAALLRDPARNKSTAFTEQEREQLGLRGLLPAYVGSQRVQLERVLAGVRRKATDLDKYMFLSALQLRNERLFYRLVMENFEEMMPLIYTPTVGQACKEFANIYQLDQGFYVSATDRGRVAEILDNWPRRDVRVIVITDGGRILGLGDLGSNGMGIPIGKLSLYCACAGIHPDQGLPVMFDVGTDNVALREDSQYLGLHQPRLTGPEYFDLMDEFMQAVKAAFPTALVQFEDFTAGNAYAHLNRYREQQLCFNDDIQGTAAVVLAGVYAATRLSERPFEDTRMLFLGAGSAASGIGSLVVKALIAAGVPADEAHRRLIFFDRSGVVSSARGEDKLTEHMKPFAHDLPDLDLLGAIRHHRPDFLIGATGSPDTFTAEMVGLMAEICERPGIFALSNPTSRAECSAAQAYEWSEGRAIFASGSPFPPVSYGGRLLRPGQGNNSYIFPGVGLGVVACQARMIPDELFIEAARELADQASPGDLAQGALYPSLTRIREVSLDIAVRVAEYCYAHDLAQIPRPADLRVHIDNQRYVPDY